MLPTLTFAFAGLVLGSFGSVLVWRLPTEESILGRSRCMHCGKGLRALQMIPLVSYLLQRGRCAACDRDIAFLYPALEAGSALLFVLAYLRGPTLTDAMLLAATLWMLLLIAAVDMQTKTIPDIFSLILFALSILAVFQRGTIDLVGLLLGGGFLGLQWRLSEGAWVGTGDVFLMIALSLILPSALAVALTLLLAYVFGAVTAVALLSTNKATRKSQIPFAPFIALGATIVLLMGWGPA